MSDINPYKIELQKYRVLIIASLARLVHLLSSLDDNKALQEWNHFAQILLTRVSETRLKAVSNRKQDENMATKPISSVFDFLGVSEYDIDRVLGSIYHVNL
jgi:HD-like signal output (HDOD) protein